MSLSDQLPRSGFRSTVTALEIGPDFIRRWHTVCTRGRSKTAKSAGVGELSADRGSVNQSVPGGSKRILGTPRWTRLSTNASCQPKKPENSQVKTRGSASTLGVELGAAQRLSSNPRERATRENLRNVADTVEVNGRHCCQAKSALELGRKYVGSPAWIRTTIHGSKGRCPTIRRPGNKAGERMASSV